MSSAASRWPAWAMALSRSNSACAFLVSVSRRARAGHALGRAPHGQDPVVGGVEVGALEAQLVVTLHAGIVAARRRWKQAPPPSYN